MSDSITCSVAHVNVKFEVLYQMFFLFNAMAVFVFFSSSHTSEFVFAYKM